jgi:hypothetical protein
MRTRKQPALRNGTIMFRRAFCAGIVVSIGWVFIITLVFALLIRDNRSIAHKSLDRADAVDERVSGVEECCANVESIEANLDQCIPACIDVQSNFSEIAFCRGCWDANTNEPPLATGDCRPGDFYTVCNSGSTNLEGIQTWSFGDLVKCLNVSGSPRWIKNAAGGGGGGGAGIFLHTFDYLNMGDQNLAQLPNHTIGYYWTQGSFVFIRGIAKGLRHTGSNTDLRVGLLPVPPTTQPSGHIEAYNFRSVSSLENGRTYADVNILAFSNGASTFDINVDGQNGQDIDIEFELFYDTV